MPNHSQSYLNRRNNPKRLFKSEEEHIQHTIKRLKERFDLEVSKEEYFQLLEKVQKTGKKLYQISANSNLFELTYRDKPIWFIYANNDGQLPARIKTVLKPYDQYVVPNKLGDYYDHIEFTDEMQKELIAAVVLSEELDLKNKKQFFQKEGISHYIKCASLSYKQEGKITPMMIGLACRSILYRYYPNDKE